MQNSDEAFNAKSYDLQADWAIFNLCNFVWVHMTIGILAMVIFVITPLKFLFRRNRPVRNKQVRRYCNMRDRENGNPSFPSGDAAAAAFFGCAYLYVFQIPWIIVVCLPLCSLGRVYVHCHWFLDTVFGSIFGVVFASYFYHETYFATFAMPLFNKMCS